MPDEGEQTARVDQLLVLGSDLLPLGQADIRGSYASLSRVCGLCRLEGGKEHSLALVAGNELAAVDVVGDEEASRRAVGCGLLGCGFLPSALLRLVQRAFDVIGDAAVGSSGVTIEEGVPRVLRRRVAVVLKQRVRPSWSLEALRVDPLRPGTSALRGGHELREMAERDIGIGLVQGDGVPPRKCALASRNSVSPRECIRVTHRRCAATCENLCSGHD